MRPRARWAASHITIALFGTTVLLAGAGLAAGAVHAARTGDPAPDWLLAVAAMLMALGLAGFRHRDLETT